MKKYVLPSIRITMVLLVLLCVIYPLFIAAVARLAPGKGNGVTLRLDGRVVGYESIGQLFKEERYFWSRPSAVDYNAAGSAGANKGPSNEEYLQTVQERIDTFLVHPPSLAAKDIPAEMATASGSGLDPHISPQAALVQRSEEGRVGKEGVSMGRYRWSPA